MSEAQSAGVEKDSLPEVPDSKSPRTAESATRELGRVTNIYETILSTTDDFAYIFDPQGRFLYANARLLKVWAKTLDQVIGKTCHDLDYPKWHADMHMREIEEIVRNKVQIRGEVPFTGASGISGVYDYIFKPVLNSEGNVEVIVGTTRDVTERKQNEEKLRLAQGELLKRAEEFEQAFKARTASEQRYRFLADTVPQIVWTARTDGTLDYYNQRWFDYSGTTLEEMERLTWAFFVHPDDLPNAGKVWQHSLDTGCDYEIEFRIKRASDGSYRWHLVRAFPMRNEIGEVIQWIGTCTDIDDQRQLNERLGESAAKFRSLFDQATVFAGILSLDGKVIEANRASLEGCGYHAREVLGRPFWECGWWRASEEIRDKIRLAIKTSAAGVAYTETLPYLPADGSVRIVDLALHPIRNDEGKVIFLNPTGVDVTERHQAHSRAEFLAQLTHKLSMLSDPEEINRVATREVGQFLGAQRCKFFEVMPEPNTVRLLSGWRQDDLPPIEGNYDLKTFGSRELAQALQGAPLAIEDVHTHAWTKNSVALYEKLGICTYASAPFSHESRWATCLVAVSSTPRRWADEELSFLENAVARIWPLIERARVEAALRESEQRFRAMSDNISSLAWMADAAGYLFWYNQRWYDYTGETFETMKGDGWAKVHDPEHLTHVYESWKTALETGNSWEDTFPLRGADGKFRWFLSRASPIRDREGRVSLWFGTNTDITDLREAQEALREANARLGDRATHLEALVQQRTQKLSETIGELQAFSYSISHDMRSPLRSMIGFSEILIEEWGDKLDATGVDYLGRISAASRRMDRLIQDVLNFSRMGRDEITLVPIDTAALIHDVIRSYPNLGPEKVTISVAPDLPFVKGSDALLTQCISNLLENGVKFTQPDMKGHIEVSSKSAGGRTKIFFKDNGIGMPAHSLDRVFDIFYRVGRDNDGTGIGLAIVRKAAEKMGGSVGVESELGKGSTFWLDLESA